MALCLSLRGLRGTKQPKQSTPSNSSTRGRIAPLPCEEGLGERGFQIASSFSLAMTCEWFRQLSGNWEKKK